MNEFNELRRNIKGLSAELGARLNSKWLTIATAESCTAGGIASAIASVDGASSYLLGGFITYTTELKESLLGIPHLLIEEKGVVSREVAEAMAVAARQKTGADIGVGVTGYIGTSGGDEHVKNGTVFYGICCNHFTQVTEMHVGGGREGNSLLVVRNILSRLLTDQKVNPALKAFVENEIIPTYASFDKAHNECHVRSVIEQSTDLMPYYEVDADMVYAIAAYHDLGLAEDRKTHHLISGRIIREDRRLRKWFSDEQIELMAQAAEDHRASSDHEPRSIYGRIVAEADRLIDRETVVKRTIQYGLTHYPELDREGHIKRALDHLDEKYAEGGYLKCWIPESSNAERLRALQQTIKDRTSIRWLVEQMYDEETK